MFDSFIGILNLENSAIRGENHIGIISGTYTSHFNLENSRFIRKFSGFTKI